MGVRWIRSRDRFKSRGGIAQLRYAEPAVITLDLGLPPDPDDVTEGFKALPRYSSLRRTPSDRADRTERCCKCAKGRGAGRP